MYGIIWPVVIHEENGISYGYVTPKKYVLDFRKQKTQPLLPLSVFVSLSIPLGAKGAEIRLRKRSLQ